MNTTNATKIASKYPPLRMARKTPELRNLMIESIRIEEIQTQRLAPLRTRVRNGAK